MSDIVHTSDDAFEADVINAMVWALQDDRAHP